jgi:hypothetical protein
MHRFCQLQPVAAEDGGNRLFFLRYGKAISVANCFPDLAFGAREAKSAPAGAF